MDRGNDEGGHHPAPLRATTTIETNTVPGRRSPSSRQREPLPKGYWTIWTTVALDLIGFGIVVPILGVYAERYGASGVTVGWLFATYSLAQMVFSPLLGRLSDHVGRKPVIVISLIGTAVGSLITGAAGALWVLFLGRAIDGASGGSLSVAQAAVTDIAPEAQRPGLIGMLGAAFGVGFVLGPAIGGLASLGGPHVPFYVAAVLAGINAVAAMIRLPETRRPDNRAESRHWSVPQSFVLRRMAMIGFLTTFGFVAFEATFSLFGKREFGLTEGSVSLVFLGIGVVLVIVQGGVYGRAVARRGVGTLYLAGLVAVVAGLAIVSGSRHWGVLVVGLIVLAGGQGVVSPSITELVTEASPADRRGQALGFQQSATAIARVVAPPLAGLAFDHAGDWTPIASGAAITALATLLVVVWRLHLPLRPAPSP